jgi:adenylylsulfate kinase
MSSAAVWFTGLPCAGKSTIAALVADAAARRGRAVRVLDGDVLRRSSSADLAFSAEDRCEQARRAAHEARRCVDGGELAVVALISPLRRARAEAREILGPAFVEVHVDAPLEVCAARDVKGLYRRAREGQLPDFTGVSSPYETPESPALRLDTALETPALSAQRVLSLLEARGAVPPDATAVTG